MQNTTDPILMPRSKFLSILLPIRFTHLSSYLYVTALLEYFMYSDCSVRVFWSFSYNHSKQQLLKV